MKRLAALLLTAAIGSTAGAMPATAEAPAALDWASCGIQQYPDLSCATVKVPLDYAHPDGRTLTLTVSRAGATGGAPSHGDLLVNPGGPGASGLAMAGSVFAQLPENLRHSYDVIGFDPRGVGRSEPSMSCVPNYYQGPRPDFLPTSKAQERIWLDRTSAYSAACGAKYAEYLPYMHTTESAQDMDRIRAALGQPKISYYGLSYGTYLGAVYATEFPRRVDRMIMDGALGPDGLSYPRQFGQDRGFETNLQEFFRWAARYDEVYRLGSTATRVERNFYALRSQLAAHPALGGVFGSAEFDVTFMGTGYSSAAWPDLARAVSDMLRTGDSTVLAKVFAVWGPNAVSDNFNAVLNAVRCTDSYYPRDYATWRRDAVRSYRQAPFTTWNNLWFAAPCMTWPVTGGRPAEIGDRPGMPPVLMFLTAHDPATPYDTALQMHHRLRSRLVTEPDGWGHGVVFKGNACVDGTAADYLATGRLPAADTTCAAGPLPAPTSSPS
jgi:pimeloyl-ACP methyl ester carboxylesterase